MHVRAGGVASSLAGELGRIPARLTPGQQRFLQTNGLSGPLTLVSAASMLHRVIVAAQQEIESLSHQEMETVSTKKTAQAYKQPIELYTAMLDQSIRANRIVAKGIERTIEEQLGLFEAVIDSTRPLAAAKQPEEVLAVQMDAWKAFGEKLVAATGKLAEIQRETGTELKDIVVDGFKAVNETFPKAA